MRGVLVVGVIVLVARGKGQDVMTNLQEPKQGEVGLTLTNSSPRVDDALGHLEDEPYCWHGGTLITEHGVLKCICTAHFTGRHCKVAASVHVCESRKLWSEGRLPCVVEGKKCTPFKEKGFTCRSVPPRKGVACKTDSRCPPQWKCHRLGLLGNDDFNCEPSNGVKRSGSEENVAVCDKHRRLCEHGSLCKSGHCKCLLHYTGKYCDSETDYCQNHGITCPSIAFCESRLGGFNCECPEDRTGLTCNIQKKRSHKSVRNPHFLYVPLQHSGIPFPYSFYAVSVGLFTKLRIDFGDRKIITKYANSFAHYSNFRVELLKTFLPPLMIRFNDVQACLLYHSYEKPGNYTIHVQLFIIDDKKSVFDSFYQVNVQAPNLCSLSLKLKDCAQDPGEAFSFELSDKIDISGDIQVNCTRPNFTFSWVVYNNSRKEEPFTVADVVKLDDAIKTTGVSLHIPEYTLPVGFYVVCLQMEMTAPSYQNATAMTWFEISDNFPTPKIFGGTFFENCWDKSLYLDASMTRDKNYKLENTLFKQDRFYWSCKQLQPPAPAKDIGYCATKRYLNTTGPYLMVPPKALLQNTEYTFTVAVNDPDNNNSITVRTVEPGSEIVRIVCESNCGDSLNPEDITTFRAICHECGFDSKKNRFKWTVDKLPEDNSALVENQTDSGFESDVLSINSNVLNFGSTYSFEFSYFSMDLDNNEVSKTGSGNAEMLKSTLDPHTSFMSKCSILPLKGYSVITNFTITCNVSFNKTLLIYEIAQLNSPADSITDVLWLSYGTKSQITDIRLAHGDEESNRLVRLRITITSGHLRAQSIYVLNATVEPATYHTSLQNGLFQQIYIQMFGGVNSLVGMLHAAKNSYSVIHVIRMIAAEAHALIGKDELKDLDLSKQDRDEFYKKIFILREVMLEYLSQQNVYSVQEIKHLATTHMKVVRLPKLYFLPSKYQVANGILENILASLKTVCNHRISKNDLLDIGESIVSIGFRTLNETTIHRNNLNEMKRKEYHIWATKKLLESEARQSTLKNLTAGVIHNILDLSQLLANNTRSNGPVTSIATEWGQLNMKKVLLQHVDNSSMLMNVSRGSVTLQIKQEYLNKTLIVTVLEATDNPYWWLNPFKGNRFPFISVDVQHENITTNTKFPVPVDCTVDLDLLKNERKPRLIHGELEIVPFWIFNESHIQTYRFKFREGGKIALRLPRIVEKIQLVIKKDIRPDIHDFWNDAMTLPDTVKHNRHGLTYDLLVMDSITVESDQLVYVGIIPHVDTLRKLLDTGNKMYRFNFPDVTADESDSSEDDEFSDVSGNKDHTSEYGEGNNKTLTSDAFPDVTFVVDASARGNHTHRLPFAFNLHVVSCHNFDESTLSMQSSHCYVNRSKMFTISCTCQDMNNPLIKFQSGFQERSMFTDTIFSITEKENPVILIVLFYIIGIFIVLFIWARAGDEEDQRKRDVIFLRDNNPMHEYTYVLIVYTGRRPQSGTTSKVAIQLVGEQETSSVHILTDSHRPVLTRGSQDWFVLKTKRDLGNVAWINLWHDHSGASPAWYCDRVIVHDIQTHNVFVFVTSQWLAPLHGDGTMSCSVDQTLDLFGKRRRFTDRFVDACDAGHHVWLSMLHKRTGGATTRCQRVGITLAYIATIIAIVAHMYAGKAMGKEERVWNVGVVIYGVIAALVVAPVYVALYWLFRCIEPLAYGADYSLNPTRSIIIHPRNLQTVQDDDDVLSKDGDQQQTKLPYVANRGQSTGTKRSANTPVQGKRIIVETFCLPAWCVFIAWFVLVVIIVSCAYVSTFQGIMLSHVLSMCFLLSFSVAILTSVLMETIKVALVAICYSLFTKNRWMSVEDRSELVQYLDQTHMGKNEHLVRQRLGELNTLRQQAIYKPIPYKRVQLLRKTAISEATARHVVGDLCMFLLFSIIIVCILYGIKHSNQYQYVRNIKSLISENTLIYQIHTQEQYISHINDRIFLQIYNKETNQTVSADLVNYLIGVPRLRQIRLSRESCKSILTSKPNWASRCSSSQPLWLEGDTEDYDPLWKTRADSGTTLGNNPNTTIWHYKGLWGSGTPLTIGNTSIYPGSGYIAPLTRTKASSHLVLGNLKHNKWYDDFTVALFLEFVLYNGDLKLVSTVSILGERTVDGGYHVTYSVSAVKLDPGGSASKIVALVVLVALVVVMVIHMREESNRIVGLSTTRYVGNSWYLLRLGVVLLGIVAVSLFVVCVLVEESAMQKLKDYDSEEFLNFYRVVFWPEALAVVLAFMYFFIILEVSHMLSFYFEFQVMLTTLHVASYSLLCYFVVFLIFLHGFVCAGHLLFVSSLATFRTFWSSFFTVYGFFHLSHMFDDTTVADSSIGTWAAAYYFLLFVSYMFIFRWGFAIILMGKYKKVVQYARDSWLDPILNKHVRAKVASRPFLRMKAMTRDYIQAMAALFKDTTAKLSPARFLAMKQIVSWFQSQDTDPEFLSNARSLAMASLIISAVEEADATELVVRANPVVRTSLRMAALKNKINKLNDLVTDLVDKNEI